MLRQDCCAVLSGVLLCVFWSENALLKPWKGGPYIPYPFKYFEKYPNPKRNITSQKFKKHCIPIFLKLILVSGIPLNIYKNIPYPFNFLVNIPVSLKTLPGPHYLSFCMMIHECIELYCLGQLSVHCFLSIH